MLSRKLRGLSILATLAVALLLALPGLAQAVWIGDSVVSPDGGTVPVRTFAPAKSAPQTVSLSYYSSAPTVSGPSSVVIPAGASSALFYVNVGPGSYGDVVWVGQAGPNSEGSEYIWVE